MSRPSYIGLDTRYPLADGNQRRRIHLDGAASPLPATTALATIQKLLPHYSNTHSYVHSSARISTQALHWAHHTILECMGADQQEYTCVFSGSGTTAGINRVARGLALARPQRKVVLVSAMEHHANDLPHRQFNNQIEYIPLCGDGAEQGAVDLQEMEKMLQRYAGQVNYVAITAVSNVTGVINPVTAITRLAHQYGALVLVDGAQAVAHMATRLSRSEAEEEVDFFVFSGHKLYTPASPGVLIAKKSVLQSLGGQDLGGGSVETVSYYDYSLLTDYPDKEQSGTTNIIGAVALATVFKEMSEYGFDKIEQHDRRLMRELQDAISTLPGIIVYGDPQADRISALAFNHRSIDHGLLAAILNDYFSIAVRNECFCAHPYVSSMMKETLWKLDLNGIAEDQQEAFINLKRGMVRASLSLYNTSDDIEALISALSEVSRTFESLAENYTARPDGSYLHKSFAVDWRAQLDWRY